MVDRVLSMLGIAAKSGKVVSGEFSTEKAVKTGKAYLVIVSEEASENTKKSFRKEKRRTYNWFCLRGRGIDESNN